MRRASAVIGFLVAMALWAGAPARAIDANLFTIGLLGGAGGPLDADDPDPGYGQQTMELQLSLVTEPRTLLVLRLGRVDFDSGDQLGDVFAPQLDYVTIAGEYRFFQDFYDSGVFFGLGGYRLTGEGGFRGGVSTEHTVVGLTGGVTGEFSLSKHFALMGQLSGHYVDLDEAQLFAQAMGGVAVKF